MYFMDNLAYIKSLVDKIPRFVKRVLLINDKYFIIEIYKDFLLPCTLFFKKHGVARFFLMDITAVDFPKDIIRFQIVYQLLSFVYNQRIMVKIAVSPIEAVSSISSIFNSAGWLEREVWDLFGIFFSGHVDLRRILTDYGFQGFPMRKDFPLSGYSELLYSIKEKRVMYVPLELSQEFRFFDFSTSW